MPAVARQTPCIAAATLRLLVPLIGCAVAADLASGVETTYSANSALSARNINSTIISVFGGAITFGDGSRGAIDESLNASTHGVAELVAFAALVLLWKALRDTPRELKIATMVYGLSLNMMYICSTCYHALYALDDDFLTSLDTAGVFILIAGTYSPMLAGLFPGEAWAKKYLVGIWTSAILGVLVGSVFKKNITQIMVLYALMLLMGWSTITSIRPIMRELGCKGSKLLIGGGVVYTLGLVFNLKNGHIFAWPDHTTWHLFVMAGSTLHFACIFCYVIPGSRKTVTQNTLTGDASTETLPQSHFQKIADPLLNSTV